MKPLLKTTPFIAFFLAGVVNMPVTGKATIIGFGQVGGNNSTVPGNLGSNVTGTGSGYSVSNGTTPNTVLSWDSLWDIHTSNFFAWLENRTVGGDAWDNEGSIPRVGQLDSTRHTVTFTTEPGFAVVLNSFDFCHTNETVGQKTEWDITLTDSTDTLVWSSHEILDNAGNANPNEGVVKTITPNFTGRSGGTYTLAFNQTFTSYGGSSNGRHAIDNLSFNQIAASGPSVEILDPATAKADIVDTMIGVSGGSGTGSTVPGPCLPQSSIYPSPDTVAAAAGGYAAGSNTVGFSQLHATGSGSSTMSFGNFLVSPRLGANTTTLEDDNGSPISGVAARPYSYRARLTTPGIDCTVVPTANCAIYQFDFPASSDARIYFDVARKLNSATGMSSGSTSVDLANGSISGGGTFDGNWNPAAYNVYFYAKLDNTPASGGTWLNNTPSDGVLAVNTASRQRIGSWVRFDTTTNRTVRMKIGISFQSVAKARQYVETEIPAWDIAGLETAAKTRWNEALGAVHTPGISKAEARKLYTALFHSLIQPRNRTGDPSGWPAGAAFWDDQYTPWDTWQTLYPLLSIVNPSSVASIVNSFGERYARNGRVETAFIQGKDFQVGQGGDEVDRIIADAYVKGIPGIDWAKVWPLLQFNAGRRTADYRNLGFVSVGNRDGYDSRMASGSSTIAFAHGDWCAALVGAGLGHTAEAQALLARSQNWRNVWDTSLTGDGFSGFVHGKNQNGTFTNVAATSAADFYQGTCWNYSFNVFDRNAMIDLMGGRARFIQRLEFAFGKNSSTYLDFGNEVNLQAVPLLARAQRPGLSSYWGDNVRSRYGINSYPGDEDSGAMASLYFFLTAGFVPAATEDTYFIHGPRIPQLEFSVGEGKKFTILAENAGGANLYVQSATLNGQPLHKAVIHHADITAGKTLAFVMGPNPSKWATGEDFSTPTQRDNQYAVHAGWKAALGTPQITGAETDSPTWGVGANGADNSAIYSTIPEITLSEAGSSLSFSATVNLTGMATTQAVPNGRFAWGIFDANNQSGFNSWSGYLAGNDAADTTIKGSIWRKGTGNSTAFHSTAGATSLTSYSLPVQAFADGSYQLVMNLTRTATGALDYHASLVRSSDGVLFAAFTGSDLTPPTYKFNRVGLRSGDVLDTDSIQVSQATVIANGIPSPPTVSLTSPSEGATFIPPATVEVSAQATASGSKAITKVEFLANGSKIGEDTTSPFTYTWTGVSGGGYVVTAIATDSNGESATSAAVTINVDNTAPTVSFTAPGPEEAFDAPASILMTVNAVDADGTVAKVEYYADGNKIGEAMEAPYGFRWDNVFTGTYALTAKAIDNGGAFTVSAPLTITVTNSDNVLPSVAITAPATGVRDVGNIAITASADDTDGTVTKVEFYNGATKLGEDTTAPYGFTWSNVVVGNYILTARATDNDGGVTTSGAVNVDVQVLPLSLSEGFDSMGATGTVLPSGWSMKNGNSGTTNRTWTDSIPIAANGSNSVAAMVNAAGVLTVNNSPTATNNNGYNAQGASSSDRVLATSPTDVAGVAIQWQVSNAGTATVTVVRLGYDIRRYTAAGSANELPGYQLFYSLDGSTWTNVPALNPTLNGAGIKVPNSAGVTTVPPTEVNLIGGWAPGAPLLLRWVDDNAAATSPDQVLGLDNVSLNAVGTLIGSAPTVAVTSPAATDTFTTPATINLAASAEDSDGTVATVEFYNGLTLLGEDATAPYTFAWANVSAGTYSVSARAIDNDGNITVSTATSVTVNPAPGSGTLTRAAYLQKASPTAMTICWRSSQSIPGRVKFGSSPTSLTNTVDETRAATDHEITLNGLSANTTYYYSIGSSYDTLAGGDAAHTFTTPPAAGTTPNTRIWVLGDAGTGTSNQTRVRDAFYNWTGSRDPNLVLQLGDNAYNSGFDDEFQAKVFDVYGSLMKRVPFWSCLGNHETGQSTAFVDTYPYFNIYAFPTAGEAGGIPSGTEHYYSFDYGNVHFISLDSMTANRSATGAMATWLTNDLASTTATWIVAFFHHPPYTKGSHNSDTESELIQMRSNILPILEKGGVDLVLGGHSHSYERSYLLDGHYGLSTTFAAAMKKNAGDGRPSGNGAYIKPLTGPRDHFGAVYAVPGSSGQTSGGSLNHPAHFVSLNSLGSLVLDVSGTRLDATFVRDTGAINDTFSIIKQGAADTDGDGISDAYEIANGLDRFLNDAGGNGDNDSLTNFLEFAFGLNPKMNDAYPLEIDVPGALLTKRGTPASWVQPTGNGTDFHVIYLRRKDAAEAGLIYTPQFSGDLTHWESSPVTPTVIADGGDVEAVSITYPMLAPSDKTRFFRVNVSSNH